MPFCLCQGVLLAPCPAACPNRAPPVPSPAPGLWHGQGSAEALSDALCNLKCALWSKNPKVVALWGAELKLVNASWDWEDFESAGCQQEPVVGPAEPRSLLEIQIYSLEATRSCDKFPWASSATGKFQFSKSYSWLCFCSLVTVFWNPEQSNFFSLSLFLLGWESC